MRTVWLGTGRIIMDLTSSWNKFWKERGNISWWHMYMKDPVWNEGKQGRKMGRRKCPVYCALACVAGVERGRGEGEFGRERERVGRALLPPPSRVVTRPISLPLPFRTPLTQANCASGLGYLNFIKVIFRPIKINRKLVSREVCKLNKFIVFKKESNSRYHDICIVCSEAVARELDDVSWRFKQSVIICRR